MSAVGVVPIDDKEHFLRIKNILDILKKANVSITRLTLDKWVKKGTFPKPQYRFGKSPVWTMAQFKEWLNECVAKAK